MFLVYYTSHIFAIKLFEFSYKFVNYLIILYNKKTDISNLFKISAHLCDSVTYLFYQLFYLSFLAHTVS